MSVTVANSAPVFSFTPLDSTHLYLGETKTYQLPSINDAEGHTFKMTHSIPKSFITFDNIDTFSFSPTSSTDLGTHTIKLTLSDSNLDNQYSFSVIVMSKPAFDDGTTSFSSLKIPLNSVKSFTVPAYSDADGDTVTISIEEGSGGTFPNWI